MSKPAPSIGNHQTFHIKKWPPLPIERGYSLAVIGLKVVVQIKFIIRNKYIIIDFFM
jgi:hypothetical protein